MSTLLDYGRGDRSKKATKSGKPTKSRKSDKNASPNQQIGDEFRGSFQNKAHKLKHPAGTDGEYTSSRGAGSSSPVPENEVAEAESSEEEEPRHTGTLWPSQVNKQKDNK